MNATTVLLLLIAIAVGMLIPLQPGINAELRLHSGSALVASLISFVGGVLVIAITLMIVRAVQPSAAIPVREWITTAPWWAYLGGVIGALFVTVALVLAPRLGAAMLVAGIVTGQLLGSVVIDHFGVVGYPRTPFSWQRAVGLVLLIGGIVFLQAGGTPETKTAEPEGPAASFSDS